jgi:periplasmic divalent cation tolerance protein
MEDKNPHLLFTTIPDSKTAEDLAHSLIDEGLAACVNLGTQVKSFYEWNGSKRIDQEIPVTIKTNSERVVDAMNYLKEVHPYDCPELLSVSVDKFSSDYAGWINEQIEDST